MKAVASAERGKNVRITIDAKEMTLRAVSEKTKDAIDNGDSVLVTNAEHLHCLASGLKRGEITIRGETGDYTASLNNGANIAVEGKVGNFVADNMTRGKVVVNNDAGHGAAEYCYGGLVLIRGSAGDFSGTMNKGATLIIEKNVGHNACTYMVAGDVVIIGDAGQNLANYLIGGNVYISGKWVSLGHNTKVMDMTPEDTQKLAAHFTEYGIKAEPLRFKKIVPKTDKPFYAGGEEVS